MASVNGDYEDDDWEAAEPSVAKKSILSATDGQVFPLVSDDNDVTRDAEPTRQEEHDVPVPHNAGAPQKTSKENFEEVKITVEVDEITIADTTVLSEEVPTSVSSVEDDKISAPDLPDDDSRIDLVRIHGHHYNPPVPPPVPTKAVKPDLGVLQARVAAKRIVEFRERQASKEEEERSLESSGAQQRREIRRSNDAMYKALGVAGLSVQDHLRIAYRQYKREAKKKEIAASLERQLRWYNCIPKHPARAPGQIRELQQQYSRANREREHRIQFKQKSIQVRQRELRQEAQAIIAKESGAYVRGSYLLKVTHHTIKKEDQPPSNEPKEVNAE